jgi:hypothetical protein
MSVVLAYLPLRRSLIHVLAWAIASPWASATAQTQKDQEEKRAKDALDTEQTKIGQSAARAAWIAVGFTVAAAIVALLAWVLPHLWG